MAEFTMHFSTLGSIYGDYLGIQFQRSLGKPLVIENTFKKLFWRKVLLIEEGFPLKTLYIVHCKVYSNIVFIIQDTVYSVQYTLDSMH